MYTGAAHIGKAAQLRIFGVALVNFSKLPDLITVGLMTSAFASVARRGNTLPSRLWLLGWVMIVLHLGAFLFLAARGYWGTLALFVHYTALASAGVLFMWAAIPHRRQTSSPWMLTALLGVNVLYFALLIFVPAAPWVLTPVAALFGVLPLFITLNSLHRFNHPLRWSVVLLYVALSIFLLCIQHRAENGAALAINAVLFTVFFNCCINFWFAYYRVTVGAVITVTGFFAWAAIFMITPFLNTEYVAGPFDSAIWNLPMYVVAMGMILLLLENQIEHNKYLALHDELTGLPNRRLFHDRLAYALERARRTGSKAALLLIDLNHFKQVNDNVGHHAGDELLRRVASIFRGRVRRSDTVARTGGDEFSIILEEPTSREDAVSVGRSLSQLLDKPIAIDGHSVRVGASVGIALFPDDAADAEALCIAADRRMYDEKRTSREVEKLPPVRPLTPKRFPPAQSKKLPSAEAQSG